MHVHFLFLRSYVAVAATAIAASLLLGAIGTSATADEKPATFRTERVVAEFASSDPDFLAQVDEAQESAPWLSYKEAYRRVDAQPARHDLVDKVVHEVGRENFAGARYDIATDTLEVLLVSSDAAAVLSKRAAEENINTRTVLVDDSIDSLYEVAQAINDGDVASDALVESTAGVDVAKNRVNIAVPAAAVEAAQGATAKLDVDVAVIVAREDTSVSDVCTSVTDCDRPIRAGIGLKREDKASLTFCSAGYGLTNSNGTKWITTAGHCGLTTTEDANNSQDNWSHDGRDIGRMTVRCEYCSGHGDVDVARIVIEDDWWNQSALGYLYNYANPNSEVKIGFVVGDESGLYEGDIVCIKAVHAGEISDKCGTIEDVSNEQNHGLARVGGYDACGGDSGGAWIYTSSAGVRMAYGSHSRSDSGCHVAGGESWFTTVPKLSEWLRDTSSPNIYIAMDF